MKITDINAARQFVAMDFRRMVEYSARLEGHSPPWFHYTVADFLQSSTSGAPIQKWVGKKKAIMGFRLAAKSWLLRQYFLWRWLRCPEMQVIIHSSTDAMAKKMARAILKNLQENPLMSHLAPNPGSTGTFEYNLSGITPEAGYSLICAGINSSLVGSRCDVYGFDDPEPDVNPESAFDRIIGAIQEAVHILHRPDRHLSHFGLPDIPLSERTQLIVVGQPHHAGTAYYPDTHEFDDDEDGHPLADAKFLVIPVVDDKGQWTWPEMMERKYYDAELGRPQTYNEVRRGFSTDNWECQMMCNPYYSKDAGTVLRLSQVEVRDRVVENPIISVDPADSLENGCLLPDTPVTGRFTKAMKSWYEGQIVKYTTASGRTLSLTPNHPVFTLDGWRRAGQIKVGDQLPCTPHDFSESVAMQEHDAEPSPPTIEEVFDTLAGGGVSTQPIAPTDFHGDGAFIHGDVHCVRADWLADRHRVASGGQGIGDLLLPQASPSTAGPPSLGPSHDSGLGMAASSAMLLDRPANDIPAHPILGRHFGLGQAGLVVPQPAIGQLHTTMTGEAALHVGRSANWNVQKDKGAAESLVADPALLRGLHQAAAGEVLVDRVVHVSHHHYSGWVYDVEADNGIVFANSIPHSNCEWGITIGGSVHGEKGHQIHVLYMGGLVGEAFEGDVDTIGESVWRQIINLGLSYGCSQMLLEVNLKAAQTACRRYMQKTNAPMYVVEVRQSTQKLRRIVQTLEQPINNGMVTFAPGVLEDMKTLKQLKKLRFDRLPSPVDRIDSMSQLFSYLIESSPELTNPDPTPIVQPKGTVLRVASRPLTPL